jgi:glutathione S-transferase
MLQSSARMVLGVRCWLWMLNTAIAYIIILHFHRPDNRQLATSTMALPTLYHVPNTISSPIYQALLEIGAVNNPVKVETLSFADLKSSEHLARNPMGTSPSFADRERDIAIWESGAVLAYLLEMYDTDFQLSPQPGVASPRDRAKFLHLQQYILATVYPFVASLYIHTLQPKEEQDSSLVEISKLKWRTLIGPALAQFLGDSTYFMGDKLTAVDLLVAKPLGNANSLEVLEEFPSLMALFGRISSMPSFATAYGQADPVNFPEGRSRSFSFSPGA